MTKKICLIAIALFVVALSSAQHRSVSPNQAKSIALGRHPGTVVGNPKLNNGLYDVAIRDNTGIRHVFVNFETGRIDREGQTIRSTRRNPRITPTRRTGPVETHPPLRHRRVTPIIVHTHHRPKPARHDNGLHRGDYMGKHKGQNKPKHKGHGDHDDHESAQGARHEHGGDKGSGNSSGHGHGKGKGKGKGD